MTQPPTKSEILITRICNLTCEYCAMARGAIELSPEDWSKVPYKLKELGVSFAPIYGAEPLMAIDSLKAFIMSCREVGLACSVITNGLLLSSRLVRELKLFGLNSITFSADINIIDTSCEAKRNKALRLIELIRGEIPDLEVICTISKEDIQKLPEFIKLMSSKEVWTHFDFYHTYKGQEGSKCQGSDSKTPNISEIMSLAKELIDMKSKGYLIHPSDGFLEYMLSHPEECNKQNWKCIGGSWITVDTDGSVFGCDDFQPESIRNRYNILDYGKWCWDDFINDWRYNLKNCNGCFWSTHIMSDLWWKENNSNWIREMIHEK